MPSRAPGSCGTHAIGRAWLCRALSKSSPTHPLCSYRRGELEGRNVAMLMPAPFCQQHDGGSQALGGSGGLHLPLARGTCSLLHL